MQTRDYALVIGINDYTKPEHNGLPPLKGAVNDANKMVEWLLSPDGGDLPLAHCKKITSTRTPSLTPIQYQIDSAYLEIDTMVKNMIKDSGGTARRFYFYFAGHGVGLRTDYNEIALCLANWSEDRRNEAIGADLYKTEFLLYQYFDEIIFLVDCCRNTKTNINPARPSFAAVGAVPRANAVNVFVGYATQYQDQSNEAEYDSGETRGVFTKVLLDGLNGAAADAAGIVTASGLKGYLDMNTPGEAKGKGYKQIPEVSNTFYGTGILLSLAGNKKLNMESNFIFTDHRVSVELLDGTLKSIRTFDTSIEKKISVSLPNGLYLLKDKVTGEQKTFQIPSEKNEADVNF
ncbi:MAG: hypothetical protein JWO03_2400 [Bacteroidetes bacterium]|nr:hypothetical protein [Bacteroidota bacterium]